MGPVIGGFLNDLVHFQATCDLMALTCLGYAGLLYWVDFRRRISSPVKMSEVKRVVATEEDGVELGLIGSSAGIHIRIGEEV